MSIFSIFLNQPRVATPETPAAAPTGPAPAPAAGQAAQPAPAQPAQATPTGQAAPAAPVRSSWSPITISLEAGLTARNFRNDLEDPSVGWAVRLCGGPRYQSSPRLSWTPSLCYTRESFSGLQDATVDSVTAGIQMGVRPTSGTQVGLNLGIGWSLLSATASMDGSTGLLYDNQSLHYSANDWSDITATGGVSFSGRVYNGNRAQVFLNVGYQFNFASWGLTPDAIDRSATDSAVSVPSTAHQLLFGASIVFGGGAQAPLPSAPAETPSTPSTPAPAAPSTPAPAAPAPTAPAAPAAPAAPPPSTATFNDAIAFNLAPDVRNAATGMAVAQGMRSDDVDPNLLTSNSSATFLVSYATNRTGSIRFDSFIQRQAGTTNSITYRTPFTNIPVSAAQIHDLMESLKNAGLPRHAATRAHREVHLTVSRDAQNRITISSY